MSLLFYTKLYFVAIYKGIVTDPENSVWSRRCFFSSYELINGRPQEFHLQTNNLSLLVHALCHCKWALRWCDLSKTFPHPGIWQLCPFLFLVPKLGLGIDRHWHLKQAQFPHLALLWRKLWNFTVFQVKSRESYIHMNWLKKRLIVESSKLGTSRF